MISPRLHGMTTNQYCKYGLLALEKVIKANSRENVCFLAVSTSQDLGRYVSPVTLPFQITRRNATVRLGTDSGLDPPNPAFGVLRRVHRSSPQDGEWVSPGPSSRQTEIANLEIAVCCDEDVRRLKIEVDDTLGMEVVHSA